MSLINSLKVSGCICIGGNYSICLSSQYGTTLKGNDLLLQEQILPFNSRFYFKELPHTEKHTGIHELILFSEKRRGCLLSPDVGRVTMCASILHSVYENELVPRALVFGCL